MSKKDNHILVRLPNDDKQTIIDACEIIDKTITDFLLEPGLKKAKSIIRKNEKNKK